MELWCFITLGFHCMPVPEVHNEQKAIIYSDQDNLQMNVRLGHLPYEYNNYAIHLINSSKNTTTLKYTFITGDNTIIINEVIMTKYNDAVVRIVLESSNGKGKLIRDFARLIHTDSSEISRDCTKRRCAIDLAWLKSYPPADDESTYRYTAASIKKQPHVVSFTDKDLLTVALGFNNTPTEIDPVHLIFAYGREDNSQIFKAGFNSAQQLVLNETFHQVYLKIQLCMDKLCGVSDMFPVIYLQYDDRRTDQTCLATRCNIILDLGDTEEEEYSNDESAAGSVVNNEVADTFRRWAWLIVVAIGAAALVLALGVVMLLRRRSKRDQNNEDEGLYATAQVTYAVLDLPPDSDRGFLIKEESTPYAVIAGALNPVMANNK